MVAAINWGDPRLPERFWSKVHPEPMSGCWLWTAALKETGYGTFWWPPDCRLVPPHRLTYEHLVAPIPTGLQIDHLCRVRSCCYPGHLEPVTCQENVLRGESIIARHAFATHCPQGHPYDATNTIVRIKKGRAGRECRACTKIAKADYYQRRVAAGTGW